MRIRTHGRSAGRDPLDLRGVSHVPVILATQVLESLAKDGMLYRAEISDASMGHRAE